MKINVKVKNIIGFLMVFLLINGCVGGVFGYLIGWKKIVFIYAAVILFCTILFVGLKWCFDDGSEK